MISSLFGIGRIWVPHVRPDISTLMAGMRINYVVFPVVALCLLALAWLAT